MKNTELANIFDSIVHLMEILGEDPFRVNSYRKAAVVLGELNDSVEDIAAAGKLLDIPGVGKSIAAKIEQYLKTGKIEFHQELLAKVPPKLPTLLGVPGLGPKTVAKLWKEANITSLDELCQALEKEPQRLTGMAGMGEKKIQQLAASLAFVASAGGRILLGTAEALAKSLLETIYACPGVQQTQFAGSLRRGKETIGDIDLLCQADAEDAPKIIAAFAKSPSVRRVLAQGDTKGSVVLDQDVQADLRVVPKESYGAALAYFTGSKEHNIRLRELAQKHKWKLNEYGLMDGPKRVAGADEAGIYKALGMEFVPPELREDHGEIEAALENKLPTLLEAGDIRGDFHMHTTASDGSCTIDEMIAACRERGYKYLCISDHSQSQRIANGLDARRLKAHVEAIHDAAARHKDILVLAGCEVDILKDGSLDFPDEVLAMLDFVIASPHAALKQGRDEATPRLIAAIRNPYVHCIGHPSGRLIGERPGMEIDIEAICREAAAHDVALEINAHHMRLDLRDIHVRAAVNAGAKLCINSDAHRPAELDMMRYGVITARRGWATKAGTLNAMTAAQLKKWMEKKRP